MTRRPESGSESDDDADTGGETRVSGDSGFDSLLRKVAVGADESFARLPVPGDIIDGKYRLEALLGRGGMGAVFKAVHLVSEKAVALKWMLHASTDEHARRRFIREARAAGRIRHPNVVDVYDVGQTAQGCFLVMELLHGETLRARLQRGTLAVSELPGLMLPVLRGVAAAHRAGVIHRDLKPDNILLCSSPEDGAAREAKVLDFGISSLVELGPHDLTVTNEGALVGTPLYMAPERFKHADSDARADVYSLGVILYEALTGRRPVSAADYPALVYAIVHERPRLPSQLNPQVPSALDAIVMRALAKDPDARTPSVEQLIAALSSLTDEVPPTRSRRRRVRWPLAAAAVSCAAALVAWQLTWRSKTNPGSWIARPEAPGGAAPLARGPFEPAAGYLSGQACVECLTQSCTGESEACAAQDRCASFVERAKTADRPLVASRRYMSELFEARWERDHKREAWLTPRDKLQACARRHCLDACRIGRKFDCVAAFEWPESFPERVQLRFQLLPIDETKPALAGWTLRACAPGTHCSRAMATTASDMQGFALLDLELSKVHINSQPLSEFDGVIEIVGGPSYFPQAAAQTAPFLNQWYKRHLVGTRDEMQSAYVPRGLPMPDQARGLLQVQPVDCEYWNAWGLTVEVWRFQGSRYVRCTDCAIAYPDKTSTPDPSVREFRPWSFNAAEVALPPGEVMLVVRDTQTGRPVSVMQHAEIRAGYENSVLMFPASKRQLAELPEEALQVP